MSWTNWLKRLWQSPSSGGFTSSGLGLGASSVPPGASRSVRLRVGVVTTVGNHREHNEDNFYVPGFGSLSTHPEGLPSSVEVPLRPADSPSTNVENGLARNLTNRPDVAGPFLVADGMGGQLAGEQASRIAVEVIPKELALRLNHENDAEAIRLAIAAANREIIAQAHVDPECSHMGTTVVLALFRPGRVLVAGIGDSRVYRLRSQSLERLTRDHDLASALISAGTIRPEEAKNHQFRHVLYLYLGSPEARDGPEDVRSEDLQAGDRFLLASDGLTGSVSDEDLLLQLGRRDDPQSIARDLVQLALKNESRDNVTCLVISVEPVAEAPAVEPRPGPSDR